MDPPELAAASPEDYAWADAGAKVKVYIDVPLAPETSDDSVPWRNPRPKQMARLFGDFSGDLWMDG